jgi:hypothetical protein
MAYEVNRKCRKVKTRKKEQNPVSPKRKKRKKKENAISEIEGS